MHEAALRDELKKSSAAHNAAIAKIIETAKETEQQHNAAPASGTVGTADQRAYAQWDAARRRARGTRPRHGCRLSSRRPVSLTPSLAARGLDACLGVRCTLYGYYLLTYLAIATSPYLRSTNGGN